MNPAQLVYKAPLGSSQGRPHVAPLSFHPGKTKIQIKCILRMISGVFFQDVCLCPQIEPSGFNMQTQSLLKFSRWSHLEKQHEQKKFFKV